MLNRLILTELAALEARFEAGCVVCIYLIDSYDNVVHLILAFWTVYKHFASCLKRLPF